MTPDATTVVVGLDVGTTGVKAIAVGPDGRDRRSGRARVSAVDAATGLVGAESGGLVDCDEGCDRRSRVARDRRDRPLGTDARPRRARRSRSASSGPRSSGTISGRRVECVEIEERIGLERLISLTGNRALTGFTAPKLLWLRRHEPDSYARIARIMLPKDYVRLKLTGEWATDVADASGTLLLDVARRRWSTEVLDALDLDPAILPPLLESPEVSGTTIACDDLSRGDSGSGRSRGLRCRGARRRDRPPRAALDRDGDVGRRLRGAPGVRERSARRACTPSAMRCRVSGMRWA